MREADEMHPSFHLSLSVRSVEKSVEFFTALMGATVTHRDPSGYVNLDLYGTQLTLAAGNELDVPGFHFGLNLDMQDFEQIVERIIKCGEVEVVGQPDLADAGTALERKKIYVKCPSGYLIELKGFRRQ